MILIGYAAIATVVVAAKLGAFDFLAEPANADDVVVVLMAGRLDMPAEHEPSADQGVGCLQVRRRRLGERRRSDGEDM